MKFFYYQATVLPPTPEVNEELLRQSQIEATCKLHFSINSINILNLIYEICIAAIKLKSQSLPLGMNPKILEKHSLPSAKETKTTITATATNKTTTASSTTVTSTSSSKLSSMYVNKTLSKSYDFESRDSNVMATTISESNTSTLERKEEDSAGFFRRLLNRSTKKKKSIDDTDANAIADTTIVLSPSPTKEPPPPIKAKPVVKEIPIRREEPTKPSVLVQTTPLNTYLPTTTEVPAEIPIQKSDKPRSGPASRQRILPQELSISPIPTLASPPESDVAASEKLPPKSPKKSPNEVTKSFGYSSSSSSPKTPTKLVLNSSKTEEIPVPEPLSASKYVKAFQQHHRSDEQLGRFKKFSSDDIASHSTTSIKSIWPDDIKNQTSRVSGILSRIDYKPELNALQQSPRRKLVEKSKSFRFYNENSNNNSSDNLQSSNNMPSLPDLSFAGRPAVSLAIRPTLLRSRSREYISANSTSGGDNKFEINDNNLIKSKDEHSHANVYTKNIILTTSKAPSNHTGNQNITQIEDNIDKIMKSSFVTVLKKSSTNDLIEIKSRNNVSVTSITSSPTSPSKDDNSWTDPLSSSTSSCSSPITTSARKDVDTPAKVPEFLKIQLNRIDALSPTRPKSQVLIFGKSNVADTKERRFSNESVEITDSAKTPANVVQQMKQNSLTKSVDSVSCNSNSSSTSSPSTPTKKPFQSVLSSTSSMTDITTTNTVSVVNQNTDVIIERRKSVSDEKIKFEKKIEELKAERKRSITNSDDMKPIVPSDSRKSSLDDDNVVVVLRKKSLSQSNTNSKEDTPELMKVFARRSLKIKDTDDYQIYDTDDGSSITKSKSLNLDSDKENQSSSEEKLDKLPGKIEIQMQPKVEKNDENVSIANNRDGFRKNVLISPKPFALPSRFGNVVNYRSTAAFMDARKTTSTSSSSTTKVATTSPTPPEPNNNNNSTVPVLNNNNLTGVRHTINVVTEKEQKSIELISTDGGKSEGNAEFKGILQRRAEWEKRAKEAFK